MSSSTDSRIPVGYVSRAHGLKGEVVVVSDSDVDHFVADASFLSERAETFTVVSARQGKHGRIVRFSGIDDRDLAESLRGRTLTIAASDRRQLDDGEHWPDDLVGMAVQDESGRELGVVAEVTLGEAQDRLHVQGPVGAFEVPFVVDLVPAVDRQGRTITIRAIPGLFSEEE